MPINHQAKVKHLYLRMGFGLSPEEFKDYQDKSLESHLNMLFQGASKPLKTLKVGDLSAFTSQTENPKGAKRKLLKDKGKEALVKCNVAWLNKMANRHSNPLIEKMVLFWHGHFACQIKMPHLALNYHTVLQKHALGNFKDLLLAIAKDAAMIRFLNNQQNRKQNPNENFAREVLELFSLGQGNLYTELDIKEAARAFTGWTSSYNGAFSFKKEWHDYGKKSFMGKTGHFGGEDIINIILEQKQTARFIANKVYRYFVNEQIDQEKIEDLANVFYSSNYDIKSLIRYLLESPWFYAPQHIAAKIKSPIELVVGMMRQLNLNFLDNKTPLFLQKALGQTLFVPPNVAGWKGGKSWIDNSSLLLRLNLAYSLFNSKEVQIKVKEEFEAKQRNPLSKKMTVTVDLEFLLKTYQKLPMDARYQALHDYVLQTKKPLDQVPFKNFISFESDENHIASILLCLMSSPEYQMC